MRGVFLVTNVPTPYRLPLFDEIARQLSEHGLALKVLFGAAGYARREWKVDLASAKFDHEILAGRVIGLGGHEYYLFTHPGLLRRIRRERPAVVVVAGYSVAALVLRLARPWLKTPLVIWSGEIRRQSVWREVYRRWLIRGAAGFIAYGSASKRYLEALGAKPARIWIGINTVETAYFGAQYQRRLTRDRSGKHVLLCVAALAVGKQLETLLHVAKRLGERRSDFEISIVGSGPERANLEALAQALNLENKVGFAGFLQREQVSEALAHASIFLFPSRYDIWGLVLVEAMAAGVPCIASIHSGATEDLIEDGVTGYAVDFTDTAAVCERIERLLDDPKHLRSVGAAAHEKIEDKVSLDVSARGIVRALRDVACRRAGEA